MEVSLRTSLHGPCTLPQAGGSRSDDFFVQLQHSFVICLYLSCSTYMFHTFFHRLLALIHASNGDPRLRCPSSIFIPPVSSLGGFELWWPKIYIPKQSSLEAYLFKGFYLVHFFLSTLVARASGSIVGWRVLPVVHWALARCLVLQTR